MIFGLFMVSFGSALFGFAVRGLVDNYRRGRR